MNTNKLKDLPSLFLEFFPLFHQKIGPLFHKHDDQYKCNKNQYKAIMVIGNMDKITPTMLGKCLDLRKGSLTTLIDSLEKVNLLERNTDPYDRRKTLLKLTDEGKNYFSYKNKEFEKNLQDMFNVLNEKELEKFMKSFKDIIETLRTV